MTRTGARQARLHQTWRHVKRDRLLLAMLLPVVVYFLIFSYWPM